MEYDILKSFINSNYIWRAISRITFYDLKLKDKEIVRPILTQFVEKGWLATKLSNHPEDKVGTLKYRITDLGRSVYENEIRRK